jgi:hypothetical protein
MSEKHLADFLARSSYQFVLCSARTPQLFLEGEMAETLLYLAVLQGQPCLVPE